MNFDFFSNNEYYITLDVYYLITKDILLNNKVNSPNKQASDDEDIEIVEPKTDTITLDSDDESTPGGTSTPLRPGKKHSKATTSTSNRGAQSATLASIKAKIADSINNKEKAVILNAKKPELIKIVGVHHESTAQFDVPAPRGMDDFATQALASMLEVNLYDDDGMDRSQLLSPNGSVTSGDSTASARKPKKRKIDSQKVLARQQRLEEMEKLRKLKVNDAKLKMQCVVPLVKVEQELPYVRELLRGRQSEAAAVVDEDVEMIEIDEVPEAETTGEESRNAEDIEENVNKQVIDGGKEKEDDSTEKEEGLLIEASELKDLGIKIISECLDSSETNGGDEEVVEVLVEIEDKTEKDNQSVKDVVKTTEGNSPQKSAQQPQCEEQKDPKETSKETPLDEPKEIVKEQDKDNIPLEPIIISATTLQQETDISKPLPDNQDNTQDPIVEGATSSNSVDTILPANEDIQELQNDALKEKSDGEIPIGETNQTGEDKLTVDRMETDDQIESGEKSIDDKTMMSDEEVLVTETEATDQSKEVVEQKDEVENVTVAEVGDKTVTENTDESEEDGRKSQPDEKMETGEVMETNEELETVEKTESDEKMKIIEEMESVENIETDEKVETVEKMATDAIEEAGKNTEADQVKAAVTEPFNVEENLVAGKQLSNDNIVLPNPSQVTAEATLNAESHTNAL